MTGRYLFINRHTSLVDAVIIGEDAPSDEHDIVSLTPEIEHVGRGWLRQPDGVFVDPRPVFISLEEVVE